MLVLKVDLLYVYVISRTPQYKQHANSFWRIWIKAHVRSRSLFLWIDYILYFQSVSHNYKIFNKLTNSDFPPFFLELRKKGQRSRHKSKKNIQYTMKLKHSEKEVLTMILSNLTPTKFPINLLAGNSGNYSLMYWEGTVLGEGWIRQMFLW